VAHEELEKIDEEYYDEFVGKVFVERACTPLLSLEILGLVRFVRRRETLMEQMKEEFDK
jgi:hypothetical protein